MQEYRQNPTPDEARFLRDSQWIVGLSKSPGWSLLKKFLDDKVAECRRISEGSESSDPAINEGLRLRLKLTKAIASDIVNWVETTEAKHVELVNQLTSEPVVDESWLQRISDQFFINEETDEHTNAEP